MGPRGIIGDLDQIDLPIAHNDASQLAEEESKARFSKTKEYKELKDRVNERIVFYQKYLPGGIDYRALQGAQNFEEIGKMTLLSSTIIEEFTQLINTYETAAEAVKEAAKNAR